MGADSVSSATDGEGDDPAAFVVPRVSEKVLVLAQPVRAPRGGGRGAREGGGRAPPPGGVARGGRNGRPASAHLCVGRLGGGGAPGVGVGTGASFHTTLFF